MRILLGRIIMEYCLEAIDMHHASPMMKTIMKLREKYNLHMKVERYVSEDGIPDSDKKFIKE